MAAAAARRRPARITNASIARPGWRAQDRGFGRGGPGLPGAHRGKDVELGPVSEGGSEAAGAEDALPAHEYVDVGPHLTLPVDDPVPHAGVEGGEGQERLAHGGGGGLARG